MIWSPDRLCQFSNQIILQHSGPRDISCVAVVVVAVVNFTPGTAKRMSAKAANANPTPAAGPLMAAITGLANPK